MIYMCLQNVTILYAAVKSKRHIPKEPYECVSVLLLVTLLISFCFNPCCITIMLLGDSLLESPLACKMLLIMIKLMCIAVPIVVLTMLMWMAIIFLFPLQHVQWTTTRHIYFSYVFLVVLLSLIYGVPAAVDGNIEQCEEPLMFPNRAHGIWFVYTFCMPFVAMFLVTMTYLYQKAKQITLRRAPGHQQGQNDQNVTSITNLRIIRGIYICVTIISCTYLICMLILIHIGMVIGTVPNSRHLMVALTGVIDLHVIIIPLSLFGNKAFRNGLIKTFRNVSAADHRNCSLQRNESALQ